MRVLDIAKALAPSAEHRIVGIRPGEKLHEVLLTEDEARHSFATEQGFVVLPEHASWPVRAVSGDPLPADFHYSSDQNEHWLGVDELAEMAAGVAAAA